ncbi:MAG TPA: hypothetical protein VLO12_11960 [Halomonas sp.]|nr:hypothetical protein [Halomonas sp.]
MLTVVRHLRAYPGFAFTLPYGAFEMGCFDGRFDEWFMDASKDGSMNSRMTLAEPAYPGGVLLAADVLPNHSLAVPGGWRW